MIGQLCLGTAALAIPGYRLSGQPMPSESESRAILDYAWEAGIRYYDTAAAYSAPGTIGDAERLLGASGIPQQPEARIISKARPSRTRPRVVVNQEWVDTCYRLRAEPYVYLLHGEKDQRDMGEREALRVCPRSRLGVSVYDPNEADYALRWAAWVQYPASPLDRAIRIARSDLEMGRFGTPTRQSRLVFAGGKLLRDWGWTLEQALIYAFDGTAADVVTVGVGSLEQLRQIVETLRQIESSPRWQRASVTGAQS